MGGVWRFKHSGMLRPVDQQVKRRFEVNASLQTYDKAKHTKNFNLQHTAARIQNLAWIVITFTDT